MVLSLVLASSRPAIFGYKIIYSQPDANWGGLRFYVTDAVEIGDIQNTQYYVVGLKVMVLAMTQKLLDAGVAEENIIR